MLVTSDGEYRCRAVVFALGVTDPWKSPDPRNRGGPALRGDPAPRASSRARASSSSASATPASRSPTAWSRGRARSSSSRRGRCRPPSSRNASVRVRYFEPLEDAAWGGGTFALDAAVERIERTESGGYRLHATGTTRPGPITIEADAAIAATGFRTPLQDLRELGLGTVARRPDPRADALLGEHDARRRLLRRERDAGRRRPAEERRRQRLGHRERLPLQRPPAGPGDRQAPRAQAGVATASAATTSSRSSLDELRGGPEIWTQKGYLARAVYPDGSDGHRPPRALPRPLRARIDRGHDRDERGGRDLPGRRTCARVRRSTSATCRRMP